VYLLLRIFAMMKNRSTKIHVGATHTITFCYLKSSNGLIRSFFNDPTILNNNDSDTCL
jgi:hypothetical protein